MKNKVGGLNELMNVLDEAVEDWKITTWVEEEGEVGLDELSRWFMEDLWDTIYDMADLHKQGVARDSVRITSSGIKYEEVWGDMSAKIEIVAKAGWLNAVYKGGVTVFEIDLEGWEVGGGEVEIKDKVMVSKEDTIKKIAIAVTREIDKKGMIFNPEKAGEDYYQG